MPDNQNIDINELIIKFLSRNCSKEEIVILQNLLLNDATNKQCFEEIKEAWISASTCQSESDANETQAAWLKIKGNLTTQTPKKSINIARLLKTAALWLLLMSIGATGLHVFENKSNAFKSQKICEITTPLGSRAHILLPDSSEVWLNAGTKFRYPESFAADQRNVYLTGEAYFKVKTNKKWPFVVHTTDVKVKAFGTTFNVKAYPADRSVIATLVEGIIKVESENSDKKTFTYTLLPKTKLTFIKVDSKPQNKKAGATQTKTIETPEKVEPNEIIVAKNVNTILSTSWKDSRWVIKREKLDNLAILLERRYDVKINLLSADLGNYKFSGIIENETLEQVLKYLKLATPIKYNLKKGQVDLSINENLKDNYTTYLKKTNANTN